MQSKKAVGIMTIIAPSVLSADFTNLKQDIQKLNDSKAQWLHYDVMDGHFVPNLSFGPAILRQINKLTDKFIDVHIMVSNPLETIDFFDGCKIDLLTFHYEAINSQEQLQQVITKIRQKGYKVGISVKPKTDIRELESVLDQVDLVLVMSVEPGFGGQKFMEEQMNKCDWLYQYKIKNNLNYYIEIDGGINKQTALVAKEHHCEVLVAGSFCFNHPVSFDQAVSDLMGE